MQIQIANLDMSRFSSLYRIKQSILNTLKDLVSLELVLYSISLQGAKRIERERQNNSQQGSQYTKTGARVVDFPLAIWNLLTNVPYMCICLATSAENFIVGCIAVFGPKFVESVFTLTPGQAALLTGKKQTLTMKCATVN